MVETKETEEKQELLEQIDRERQTLANEVESKSRNRSIVLITLIDH